MRKVLGFVGVLVATMAFSIGICSAGTLDLSKMKIQWQDEFEGSELNANNWTCQLGNGNSYGIWEWGNNEKQWYTSNSKNVNVSDGVLNITAQSETVSNYNYTSARIVTKDKANFGLGYVEARLKIPNTAGLWPAFWMLGTNGKSWPDCGEIDIMESFKPTDFVQSTIHWAKVSGKDLYQYQQSYNIGKTEWHTYGVYRDEKVLRFYIDGNMTSSYDISTDERAELRDDYYVLLNVACGGNLAGTLPAASNLPSSLQVDYVRYYVNKTAADIAAENMTTKSPATTAKPTTITVKKATIKSLKNIKGKKMKVTLKKISGVAGYQIRYCDNKKFSGYEVKNTKKLKITIKKLDKKSTYYVKARAYKKVGNRKKYGKWSKVKKVQIKK